MNSPSSILLSHVCTRRPSGRKILPLQEHSSENPGKSRGRPVLPLSVTWPIIPRWISPPLALRGTHFARPLLPSPLLSFPFSWLCSQGSPHLHSNSLAVATAAAVQPSHWFMHVLLLPFTPNSEGFSPCSGRAFLIIFYFC